MATEVQKHLEETQWPKGPGTDLQGCLCTVGAICEMPLSCPKKHAHDYSSEGQRGSGWEAARAWT